MRINTNISALNAHRQLGINTSQGANAMERLSSGLRINRAGDDAAGLAISEKMRGQIRGLKQASRNAQDGISLIQTAEGALNETHSILQRMRELATQASTDTNTDTDRLEIQKEITQLTREVDRIARTTQFNTMELLDGTYGTEDKPKIFHIGANEGQQLAVQIADMRAEALGIVGTEPVVKGPDEPGDTDEADTPASVSTLAGNTASLAAILGVEIDESSDYDGEFTLTVEATETGGGSIEYSISLAGPTGFEAPDAVTSLPSAAEGVYTVEIGDLTVTLDEEEIDGMGDGDKFEVTFTATPFVEGGEETGETEAGEETGETGETDGPTVEKTGPNADRIGEVTIDENSELAGEYELEFAWESDGGGGGVAIATLKDSEGNPVGQSIELDDGEGEYTIGDITFEIDGDEIPEDASDDFSVFLTITQPEAGEETGETDGPTVDEDDVALFDESTLHGVNVDTQEDADKAISKINKAIEYVSAERSKLGAMQNRLEHTIANLGTSAENLQAAESRIRDLDMAEEIMSFTKNTILQQAATAMLAQANIAPQTVLQLLG